MFNIVSRGEDIVKIIKCLYAQMQLSSGLYWSLEVVLAMCGEVI